ncbi:DUF21-domain-containing protein [Daedalea quercina L-15889]|uniref:DUF21-domain-containing protein n=1 Tax=Daedalea quercina L-15889 TaxID=1314783 RepID=A0A165KTC0_9APHY|nr:DUF21-domain-containing protein [Daedalea quercina L-15889]
MLPTATRLHLQRLLLPALSAVLQHVPFLRGDSPSTHSLARRELSTSHKIVYGILIPVLVILSGIFAGLTLGYMSLDETQLNVLSISGTATQKEYANKIKPIRKNGHLLLVTLLLANMITNETLPVIADPVLGGGVQAVIVSTALVVIFAEIIPQSLCTRYGLFFGAKMAGVVQILIYAFAIVAWPVAKLLELALGPHHGIIYRRAELKELIAMHSDAGELGGDLRRDTVTIIGGALDLQEKVVKQAMTPIENVFMLSIDAKLDYETLRNICMTGHSRVPVYEEVDIPAPTAVAGTPVVREANKSSARDPAVAQTSAGGASSMAPGAKTIKAKKVIGILLVKQCVLLDPADATPVRKIPLNKVPIVPHNESLLGILDKFQEGRSHMAIVSRFSVERAQSVKKAVKQGLTQRLRSAIRDSDSEDESSSDEEAGTSQKRWGLRRKKSDESKSSGSTASANGTTLRESSHGDGSEEEESALRPKKLKGFGARGRRKHKAAKPEDVDLEMGVVNDKEGKDEKKEDSKTRSRMPTLPALPARGFWGREQDVPADAVLSTEGAEEFLQSVDPAVVPLGIITLEDVLEELIGEEIYDEFDPQGHPELAYAGGESKPKSQKFKVSGGVVIRHRRSAPQLVASSDKDASEGMAVAPTLITTSPPSAPDTTSALAQPNKLLVPQIVRPSALRGLNPLNLRNIGKMSRSRSAPPIPRDEVVARPKDGDSTPAPVPEGKVLESPQSMRPDQGSSIVVEQTNDTALTGVPEGLTAADTSAAPAIVPEVVHVDSQARARTRLSPLHSPTSSPPLSPSAITPLPPPMLAASSKPSSRSASPSPSLEHVIMLERKRRAASAGAGSMPAPKGLRFKSSPLTGDRTGVIVAEQLKRVKGASEEDGSIPRPEKDKEGPDIENAQDGTE